MPGDLPSVDSNEDKEGLVCVCACVCGEGVIIIAVDPRDGSHWAAAS